MRDTHLVSGLGYLMSASDELSRLQLKDQAEACKDVHKEGEEDRINQLS
jgi:hypothetical protein